MNLEMFLYQNVTIKEEQIPDYIRQGKDREVVPLLYKKVLPQVEKYILRNSGNKEDAFDVFQDALLVFYKQVIKNSFDPKYKVFGYLYRISIHLWLNKIKKDKRMQLVDEYSEPIAEAVHMNEPMVHKNDTNILATLFSGIGEKCIELLTNTIYYNLLLEDVMIRMNMPSVSAVKMQQQRCKQKLMLEIEKNPALADKLKSL